MNLDEKRDYLDRYILQQAKIKRLYEQSKINTDKKEIYELQICRAKQLRDDIENAISLLKDERESEILAHKYMCGRSLEETAGILNYSKRQVERIHINALEHITLS